MRVLKVEGSVSNEVKDQLSQVYVCVCMVMTASEIDTEME